MCEGDESLAFVPLFDLGRSPDEIMASRMAEIAAAFGAVTGGATR